MNSLSLLENYEQFAAYFMSLAPLEDNSKPIDIDEILDLIEEDFS